MANKNKPQNFTSFQNDCDRYLTLTELRAKLGGRSRSAIYLDLEAGRIPTPIKLGGRLLWIESEVDAHLRALRA